MPIFKTATFAGVLLTILSVNSGGQGRLEQPSLDIGGAQISLGMTVEQVKATLDKNGKHLRFLWDEKTALVVRNGTPTDVNDFDAQVTINNGRVVYVSFQFPEAHSAAELAQEIAGAIESVEAKNCSLENFSGHGTGGGTSQIIATCGSKTIVVMTVEPLRGNRSTHVEITIGSTTQLPPVGH